MKGKKGVERRQRQWLRRNRLKFCESNKQKRAALFLSELWAFTSYGRARERVENINIIKPTTQSVELRWTSDADDDDDDENNNKKSSINYMSTLEKSVMLRKGTKPKNRRTETSEEMNSVWCGSMFATSTSSTFWMMVAFLSYTRAVSWFIVTHFAFSLCALFIK